MQFHGFQLDLAHLAQVILAVAALVAALRGKREYDKARKRPKEGDEHGE